MAVKQIKESLAGTLNILTYPDLELGERVLIECCQRLLHSISKLHSDHSELTPVKGALVENWGNYGDLQIVG